MQKVRILIIDDEEELLQLLERFLTNEGFEVTAACNGKEGLDKFKEQAPDLIICDIMMPEVNGYDVLKEVKKKKEHQTPFIMLTGVDELGKIERAYYDAVDCYVTKPFDRWLLLKNIRTLLNIAKHYAVEEEPPPRYY